MKIPHLSPLAIIALCSTIGTAGVTLAIFADMRMHAETHQHVVAVAKVASKAETLAQRDAALIYAVCREIHARDVVEAYYDNAVAQVAHEYASRTNAYSIHVRPLYIARNRAISRIASSDCQALVTRAMDARIPTVLPSAAGTPF